MDKVRKHAESLECYACHVQMNYSKDKSGKPRHDTDWIASANKRTPDGQTAESALGVKGIQSPGIAIETNTYLRWEEPVLGINSEDRVTPLMPGCQIVFTVIDRQGKTLTYNETSRSADEAKEIGQKHLPLGMDMAPVQPHWAQRKARTCESCHNNPKAMSYGISGGVFMVRTTENVIEDLMDQKTGKPIPKQYKIQISKIDGLDFDWSTIINQKGEQVQTVGTHWPLSRALPKKMRVAMERTGLCMGCHFEMGNEKLWDKVSTEGQITDKQHIKLMNKVLKAYAASKSSKSGESKK